MSNFVMSLDKSESTESETSNSSSMETRVSETRHGKAKSCDCEKEVFSLKEQLRLSKEEVKDKTEELNKAILMKETMMKRIKMHQLEDNAANQVMHSECVVIGHLHHYIELLRRNRNVEFNPKPGTCDESVTGV